MKGKGSKALAASSVLTTIQRISTPVKAKMSPAAREFSNGVCRPLAEGVFFIFACEIFGNLTVRQQVQYLFVRHVVADVLEDFSQKLSVFLHNIILFYLTGA